MFSRSLLTATAVFAASAWAQLSGTVGPTTTTAQKAATKICNILDYGGVASIATDNSAAIAAAWSACASGGQVYVPKGDYGFATWLTLKHGAGVSINIEGTIYRTGTGGGNMIFIRDSSDVEIYSATATGAIQAYGYEFHKDGQYGARILRLYKTTDFSIHDLALVDAPQFHLTIDTCTNGEIYNVVIHGGYKGGLDGIDVAGTNIWIHDVEVSNKDECVTVKNPSSNLLIESVHCNWSGGCAMGSLSTGTDIHDVEYRNIYTHHSNQMYMIKSNGGSGSVYNVTLDTFTGHSNAYTFDMDTAWAQQSKGAGDGISYHDITVENWSGTCQNGVQRGPVKIMCPASEPCYDMTFKDFNIWTETGSKEYHVCANAYGSGVCLDGSAEHTAAVAVVTQTVTTATNYAYATMANELTAGFDVSSSIPIPTIPASFYPGVAPKSAILSAAVAERTPVISSAEAVATSTPAAATSTPVASSAAASSAAPVVSSAASSAVSSVAASSAAPIVSSAAVVSSAAPVVASSAVSVPLVTAASSAASSAAPSIVPSGFSSAAPIVPSGASSSAAPIVPTGFSSVAPIVPTGGAASSVAVPSPAAPFGNATTVAAPTTTPAAAPAGTPAAAESSSCPDEITSTVTKWATSTNAASPTPKVPVAPNKPLMTLSTPTVKPSSSSSSSKSSKSTVSSKTTTTPKASAKTPSTTPVATTPAVTTPAATGPAAPATTAPALSWTMSFTNGTAPAASTLVTAPGTAPVSGAAPASTMVTLTRPSKFQQGAETRTFSRSRPSGFRQPPPPPAPMRPGRFHF